MPKLRECINFTKSYIDSLPPAEKGKRYMVHDSRCNGLSLRVTDTGVKSFLIQNRVNGKIVKVTLGKYPNYTLSQAREDFIEEIRSISKGINPNELKKKDRQATTLKELFNEYMVRYSKVHKKSWVYDEREIPKFLGHWFNRPLVSITNQEIRKLHEMTYAKNGLYQANRILERLRAMYNKGIEWGYIDFNPSDGIKKYKEVKRDRFLKADEMVRFFNSLEQEENLIAKSYFYILLFTGARKSNVLAMRWEDIDFYHRVWRIPDTKNGEPQTIPLIEDAMISLNSLPRVNEWVFPSATSSNGHFADPKRPWTRILERAGITNLRMHDIRRTLGSYQAIMGSSMSIIGKSLGHKSMEATQIYARLSTDPVRSSMETAVGEMKRLANIKVMEDENND